MFWKHFMQLCASYCAFNSLFGSQKRTNQLRSYKIADLSERKAVLERKLKSAEDAYFNIAEDQDAVEKELYKLQCEYYDIPDTAENVAYKQDLQKRIEELTVKRDEYVELEDAYYRIDDELWDIDMDLEDIYD